MDRDTNCEPQNDSRDSLDRSRNGSGLMVDRSSLGGKWRPASTQDARRRYLRASRVSEQPFIWALLAGALSIVALAGLWIVMFRMVRIPGNTVPDFSKYPVVTVVVSLAMASLVSSVAEEAGFRGHLQVALESGFSAPAAILIQALLIAPAHGLTQGFVWPTVVFYLLVDAMLGTSAYLTRSIVPGVIVHSAGLLTFFSLIWPEDRHRVPIRESGADQPFWIHVAHVVVLRWIRNRRVHASPKIDVFQPATVD